MSRVPWPKTPAGAAPLRVRDHAAAVLLGWSVPAMAALGAGWIVDHAPHGVRWVRLVLDSPVMDVLSFAAFLVGLGMIPAVVILPTVGVIGASALHDRGVGGLLPVASAGAAVGAAFLLALGLVTSISWTWETTSELTAAGAWPGVVFASCYWLALRLLRPAAFVPAR